MKKRKNYKCPEIEQMKKSTDEFILFTDEFLRQWKEIKIESEVKEND